jgi:hypothetical protein
MTQPDIDEELLALAHLKDMRDVAKDTFEIAEREFKAHQTATISRMEAADKQGSKAFGMSFTLTKPTHFGQIQDRSVFVTWAEENDPELVETKERAALLNALVRAKLDDGEPLPPGVGFYSRQHISMRDS